MQRRFFLIKTGDRLLTFLLYLNTIEQRPKNIVMIGKNWNSQYFYSRLILENYIKMTKIVITSEKQIKGGYMNDTMIIQPLNTKLLLMRNLE